MSIFHFHCKNTKEASKLWHSLMARTEGKSFSMKTKLRKVQKMTILAYLKILYEGSCWEQLDKGWHSPTSAGSPSSPDANPFSDDMEGDVLQPWRMVIITIATLWETRNRQTQHFSVTESQGSSSTRSSKLPSPCLFGWGGHRRSPCNRPTGPACPAGTNCGSIALSSGARSTKDNRGVPVGRSPRPQQGAAEAPGAHGTTGALRKLPFSGQHPRAALQSLRLEPVISAAASASFLPFLGGDFSHFTPVPIYAVIHGWRSEHVGVCFQIQGCFWGKDWFRERG